jgi:LemA protein
MLDQHNFWNNWGWLVQIALALVLLFWMVGAYNRLVRLRGTLAQAWGHVDELLTRRALALELLLAAVREPLAQEAGSLLALEQAQARQHEAAEAARTKAHNAELLTAWSVAERELIGPLARLQALLEQHPELMSSDSVRPAREQLHELGARLTYARQTFNAAVQAYNDALEEFPTRLLKRFFRFLPAASV